MNKKLIKIMTLILSCLILIGAAVGITAFAEDKTHDVQIYKKNISYQGAIKVIYLVETKEGVEGTVKIVFGDASGVTVGSALADGANVQTSAGKYTLDGKEYDAVYSDGIYAKNYRLDKTATPVVVDAEGKVVAKGETVTYSPFTYAMNRFNSKNYTEDQLNLYKALLDYGASVQTVLGYEDNAADADYDIAKLGGWADEYYQFTFDGGETESYRAKELKNGYDFTEKVPDVKTISDSVLFVFGDQNGNRISASGKSLPLDPGNIALTSKWISTTKGYTQIHGLTNDFENGTMVGVGDGGNDTKYSLDGKLLNYSSVYSNVYFSATDADNTLVTDNAFGTKYVFEADMKIIWTGNQSSGWVRDSALIYFGFSNDNTQGYNSMAEYFTLTTAWNGDALYATIGDQTFDCKTEFIKIRFEYVVGGSGMQVYLDGVYVGKLDPAGTNDITDTSVHCFQFDIQRPKESDQHDLQFDNVYCGIETPSTEVEPLNVSFDATYGNAMSDSYIVFADENYTLPTPTAEDSAINLYGWYDETDNLVASSGVWAMGGNRTLTAKWARTEYVKTENGVTNNFDDPATASNFGNGGSNSTYSVADGVLTYTDAFDRIYFATASGYHLISGNEAGTKYVWEGDLKLILTGYYDENWQRGGTLVYFGFSNIGDDKYSSMSQYFTLTFDYDGENFYANIGNQRWICHEEFTTLRFEYTVGGTGMDLYINGEYVEKLAPTGTNNESDAGVDLFQFDLQRPHGNEYISMQLDNVYCGIEKPQIEILENP